MDFVIGGIPPSGRAGDRSDSARGQVEARVLNVRAPRRRRGQGSSTKVVSRRKASAKADPPGAQVVVLLVPDAHRLPADLETGDYRVFLRITRAR